MTCERHWFSCSFRSPRGWNGLKACNANIAIQYAVLLPRFCSVQQYLNFGGKPATAKVQEVATVLITKSVYQQQQKHKWSTMVCTRFRASAYAVCQPQCTACIACICFPSLFVVFSRPWGGFSRVLLITVPGTSMSSIKRPYPNLREFCATSIPVPGTYVSSVRLHLYPKRP